MWISFLEMCLQNSCTSRLLGTEAGDYLNKSPPPLLLAFGYITPSTQVFAEMHSPTSRSTFEQCVRACLWHPLGSTPFWVKNTKQHRVILPQVRGCLTERKKGLVVGVLHSSDTSCGLLCNQSAVKLYVRVPYVDTRTMKLRLAAWIDASIWPLYEMSGPKMCTIFSRMYRNAK